MSPTPTFYRPAKGTLNPSAQFEHAKTQLPEQESEDSIHDSEEKEKKN